MARLSITVTHGMAPDAAKEHFQSAIQQARTRYFAWIKGIEWTDDGHAATIVGPGFEVRSWCDEREVHIEGTIPRAWKLFEGAFRSRVKENIKHAIAGMKFE